MKNKEKLNILILCSVLFLSGCGASDAPQSYGESDIPIEEPEDSEMFKLYQELVESALLAASFAAPGLSVLLTSLTLRTADHGMRPNSL